MNQLGELDPSNLAELDMFVRLLLIGEQSPEPGALSRRLAATVLNYGPDSARAEAHYQGSTTAAVAVERVISYMAAIRTERQRHWTVTYEMGGREHPGTMIENPHTARAQYGWAVSRFGTSAYITEYTTTLTSVPVDADKLPADEHHQAPDVPGAHKVSRLYRFDGVGPASLPNAAAVAATRERLRFTRRPFALPPVLLDTVRVVMARRVGPAEVAPVSAS